jgi:hypothetical protein
LLIHTRASAFTDLAVIFRPGLISHPSHELSPTEHRLSQDVLEFLIAHQDWFMLDTPPPPALSPTPSRSLTPPIIGTTNVSLSDDEGPEGWRLIDRRPRPPSDRKHGAAGKDQERGQASASSPGIMRSRTVPPSRKGRPSTADGSTRRGTGASGSAPSPSLLRKARPTSVQPV